MFGFSGLFVSRMFSASDEADEGVAPAEGVVGRSMLGGGEGEMTKAKNLIFFLSFAVFFPPVLERWGQVRGLGARTS